MTIDSRSNNSTGQSTHSFTKEGSTELKSFAKKLVFLWILQFVLNQLIDDGTLPDDPWIAFWVNILVWTYIALNIIRWVNMEIKFLEETEWYKAQKAKQVPSSTSYELTEEGKEITKTLIKRIVYISLFFYLVSKLVFYEIVEFNLGIIGAIIPLIVIYFIVSFSSKWNKIVKQKPGSFQRSRQDEKYSTNGQPVDIYGSNFSTTKQSGEYYSPQAGSKDQSSSIFSSKVIQEDNYCKKCYGGLNDQGKCNQCDQKW